jgi:hypothetical protein
LGLSPLNILLLYDVIKIEEKLIFLRFAPNKIRIYGGSQALILTVESE